MFTCDLFSFPEGLGDGVKEQGLHEHFSIFPFDDHGVEEHLLLAVGIHRAVPRQNGFAFVDKRETLDRHPQSVDAGTFLNGDGTALTFGLMQGENEFILL